MQRGWSNFSLGSREARGCRFSSHQREKEMRRASADLSEDQRALAAKCEELLASPAWNRAHTATYNGLVSRLEMIEKSGLPRMRVVPNKKLEEIRRIPRSSANMQVDALEAVRSCGVEKSAHRRPRAVLLFISHRWARPDWCEELQAELPWKDTFDEVNQDRKKAMEEGKHIGHPDDAYGSKARALCEYAKWFKRARCKGTLAWYAPDVTNAEDMEIFWWIDFACTNQDDLGPDMAALPAYAAACSGIVATWTDEYASRAWCQVELLMAHAFMTSGNCVFTVPTGFKDSPEQPLELIHEAAVVADPGTGQLTNEGDRAVIRALSEVAEASTAFSCWRTFVKTTTESAFMCCVANVGGACQLCGYGAYKDARRVRPGVSVVWKLAPSPIPATPSAPSNRQMLRESSSQPSGDNEPEWGPILIRAALRKNLMSLLSLQVLGTTVLTLGIRSGLEEQLIKLNEANAMLVVLAVVLILLPIMGCVKDKHPWNLALTVLWSALFALLIAGLDAPEGIVKGRLPVMVWLMQGLSMWLMLFTSQRRYSETLDERGIPELPADYRFCIAACFGAEGLTKPGLSGWRLAGFLSWLGMLAVAVAVFTTCRDMIDWGDIPTNDAGEQIIGPTPYFLLALAIASLLHARSCYKAWDLCAKIDPDHFAKGVTYWYADLMIFNIQAVFMFIATEVLGFETAKEQSIRRQSQSGGLRAEMKRKRKSMAGQKEVSV